MPSTTPRTEIDPVKQLLKQINQEKKRLGTSSRYLNMYLKMEPNSLESIRQMHKTILKIQSTITSSEAGTLDDLLMTWTQEEKRNLESFESKLISTFSENLYNILREKGLKLEGQLPKLRVGFYFLDIDFEKNTCRISYGQDKEPIDKLEIDAHKISNFIEDHKSKLRKSYSDVVSFTNQLEKAYSSVLKKTNSRSNGKAPIIEVMLELSILKQKGSFLIDPVKRNFQNYGRIQFSYDLYRLLLNPSEKIRIKLSTATRAHARDRGKYLWVPKNEQGAGSIYSHIELVRE